MSKSKSKLSNKKWITKSWVDAQKSTNHICVSPTALTHRQKAFNHYKAEYKKNVAYDLIISQFRSIRQDLTVQNIRNSFTV